MPAIEVAAIEVSTETAVLYRARDPRAFETIALAGDAERMTHPEYLRVRVTGVDPQLILPSLPPVATGEALRVKMRLRVAGGNEQGAP